MKVVFGKPPIFDRACEAFPVQRKLAENPHLSIYFAWGDTVYVVGHRVEPQPHVLKHERVHLAQQAGAPEAWWERYLLDPEFRLSQELPAFVAEFCSRAQDGNRYERRAALSLMVGKMTNGLYRFPIGKDEARRLLVEGFERHVQSG